jgi:hypothetical protein
VRSAVTGPSGEGGEVKVGEKHRVRYKRDLGVPLKAKAKRRMWRRKIPRPRKTTKPKLSNSKDKECAIVGCIGQKEKL